MKTYADGVLAGVFILASAEIIGLALWGLIAVAKWAWSTFKSGLRKLSAGCCDHWFAT